MKSRYYKPKPALFRCRSGFTLIEVIATLVLSSVLIAMLLPLIDSGLEGSRRALLRLPETQSLRTDMDAVWHLYRTVYPTDLPALSTAIDTLDADSPLSYSQLWVDFDAGVEALPPAVRQDALRLTLGNPNTQGETLTAYFFPIPSPPETP